MKVVVVLPAYNCAKSLKKTISEIPQDVVNEIVLVDDFSSDDTLGVAEECCIKHIIKHDRNLGYGANLENPLKVAPLIQSNLTPVKFFHSFILFILIFFVFFLSVMPGSTLNFVYKYNDSFLLLHLRSDSPKSSIRIA